jgi:hypothetical protein
MIRTPSSRYTNYAIPASYHSDVQQEICVPVACAIRSPWSGSAGVMATSWPLESANSVLRLKNRIKRKRCIWFSVVDVHLMLPAPSRYEVTFCEMMNFRIIQIWIGHNKNSLYYIIMFLFSFSYILFSFDSVLSSSSSHLLIFFLLLSFSYLFLFFS